MVEGEGMAATAADMAFRLWRAEKDRDPTAQEQQDFLALVSQCVIALRARRGSTYDMTKI